MFKKSYNRAVLSVRIETVTPLLIRAGDAGLSPSAAELTCVRTHHARRGLTVYIPGSSLKGVLRSAAEASVRGEQLNCDVAGACDPLDHDTSCGGKLKSSKRHKQAPEPTSFQVHRAHCLACRLFGSLAMKGRASVRDLFPWAENARDKTGSGGDDQRRANELEIRHGVSIDRVAGSVRHGPFEQEMVPAGVSFWGEIALENYQVWQLGLLAQAFDEINEGFAQLGSTKSRGLGVARVELTSILHEQRMVAGGGPAGVGSLATEQERQDYGFLPELTLPPSEPEQRGLAQRFSVKDAERTRAWLDAGLQALGGLR